MKLFFRILQTLTLLLFFYANDSFGQTTLFALQPNYVAVRTPGRTSSQPYYEFWDSNSGWAGINCGNISVTGQINATGALSIAGPISTADNLFGKNIYLGNNGNTLRLMPSNSGVEIGSSTGNLTFWYSGVGYTNITCGNVIANGYVGIGTTTPGAPLHVFSPSGDVAYFQSGTGTTNFKITQEILNGRYGMKIGTVGASEDLRFTAGSPDTKMVLLHTTGNVGIGVTSPAYKLDVLGTIRAQEILVNLNGVADYVFESSYKIMPLNEVERFVKTNKHLPEIPSAKEVEKNGLNMGEMQNKLLQKIEELTLYVIEQQKQINELKEQNLKFSKDLDTMKK